MSLQIKYINTTWFLHKSLWLFMIFMGWSNIQAQILHQDDVILQPSELLESSGTNDINSAYINQEGILNDINLIQDRAEGAILDNVARVLQVGRLNLANIIQQGEGNQLILMQQGSNNLYELVSDGTNIQVAVVQDGERNEILQNITNSSDIRVNLEQRGNDNSIIQELDGVTGRAYSIRQIGDGMSIIIRQSGG